MSDEANPAPLLMVEKPREEKDTIVIAEDSPPNRKILAHLLEKLGFNVVACENGGDAWTALNDSKNERVICVISDIMMPTMDGLELLRKIRGQDNLSALPVILVTAMSEKEYIAQAKELKVSGYILKPVTFQRVTSKLQEIFPKRVFPKIAV